MRVKISANLDTELIGFLERYRQRHGLKTRSQALEKAIRELRRADLRSEFAAAAKDPDQQADADWWAFTGADGLRG